MTLFLHSDRHKAHLTQIDRLSHNDEEFSYRAKKMKVI